MRDMKNKICTDCELVALLEDNIGMELLVSNIVISLNTIRSGFLRLEKECQ